MADRHFPGRKLKQARKALHIASRLLADIQDISPLFRRRGRHRQEDLVDPVAFNVLKNIFPAAYDRNAIDKPLLFVWVIIDDTDYPAIYFFRIVQIPKDHLPGCPGTDEHDTVSAVVFHHLPEKVDETIGKPHREHQKELQDRAKYKVCHRHTPIKLRNCDNMKYPGDDTAQYHPYQLRNTGEFPDAPVHPQQPEYGNAEDRIDRCKTFPRLPVPGRDPGKAKIKPQPQRRCVGDIHCNNIIDQHQHSDHLPTFNLKTLFIQRIPPPKHPACCRHSLRPSAADKNWEAFSAHIPLYDRFSGSPDAALPSL